MDFLNNIWTAISTPNESLINIMLIPCSIIESIIVTYLAIYLLNIKVTRKQKFIYITLLSLEGILTLYLIPAPYNSFVNYIIAVFLAKIILKTSLLKSLLAVIVPTVIWGLIGTLILNPFVKILRIDYNIAELVPIYRLSYNVITYICLFLIILLFKNQKLYMNVFDNLDKKTKFTFIMTIILGFVILGTQLVITVFYTDTLPVIISTLSFITLLFYIIINIYSLTKVTNLTITKQQLQNAEEYNNTLQIMHDNIRGFRHDYNNKITTLGGFIKTNDIEGLKKYYAELEKECVKANQLHMLNPKIINNPGIYSLLTTKYNLADENDIDFNIDVLLDLNSINMKLFDFTKILGILLDNAIDASKECDKKIINVSFRDDAKNNRQLLIIENTYKDKDVDINKIFEKGITSKKEHTGLGLWEIRKILKRNNNLNLHTTKNNEYFKQQFEIYK